MYIKEFEIRWSDMDANRHLANSAYFNFMSHTRMSFFWENGITQEKLAEHGLGPVVFHEQMHYFREALPGRPVRVSLEVTGLSADGMFFGFHHNFYDADGIHIGHCRIMGGWIDLTSRKLTGLPDIFLELFEKMEKSAEFRELTRADTRPYPVTRQDLE